MTCGYVLKHIHIEHVPTYILLYTYWVTNTKGGMGKLLLHATLFNITHPCFRTLHKIYKY